jgi:cyclopropane fatty-acyl-phospholipid synthase-like methyltransferase
MNKYWKKYWNGSEMIDSDDLQIQVGRSKHKVPIAADIWRKTIDNIFDNIGLETEDSLLDVCCGNGCISIPATNICKNVTGIDISDKFVRYLKSKNICNLKVIKGDAACYDYKSKYNKIILYFSIQHFNLKEVIILIGKLYDCLVQDGVLYIGDIPDLIKKWDFFHKKEFRKDYFNSILSEKPIIGSWFSKDFFVYVAEYLKFNHCEIIEQPSFMINSNYRFDVLIRK